MRNCRYAGPRRERAGRVTSDNAIYDYDGYALRARDQGGGSVDAYLLFLLPTMRSGGRGPGRGGGRILDEAGRRGTGSRGEEVGVVGTVDAAEHALGGFNKGSFHGSACPPAARRLAGWLPGSDPNPTGRGRGRDASALLWAVGRRAAGRSGERPCWVCEADHEKLLNLRA